MQVRRRALLHALFVAICVAPLASCGSRVPDTLFVRQVIPLPGGGFTHIDIRDDTIRVAGGGILVGVDSTGAELLRVEVADAEPVHWMAHREGRTFLRGGSVLAGVDGERVAGAGGAEDSVPSGIVVQPAVTSFRAVALDPLGRFVYATGEDGELYAYDAAELVPVWGWAAVGAVGTAIGVTPHGERLYQAVAPGDGPARILVRDVQTGRVTAETATPDPVHLVLIGPDDAILALGWSSDGDGSVTRYGWSAGALEAVWSRSLGELEMVPPLRARLSPSGRFLAILSAGHQNGLHVLDVEAGRTVDRLRDVALDVAFDHADRLFLLYGSEVRRVE